MTYFHQTVRDLIGSLGLGRLIALTLGGLLVLSAGPSAAATLEEIKSRGHMIIVTEDDYPPFEFIKDGQPQGLDHKLNIERVLIAAGSSKIKIIKVNIFLDDLSEWERMNVAYAAFFEGHIPARRTVQAKLVGGFKVEIDAVALE